MSTKYKLTGRKTKNIRVRSCGQLLVIILKQFHTCITKYNFNFFNILHYVSWAFMCWKCLIHFLSIPEIFMEVGFWNAFNTFSDGVLISSMLANEGSLRFSSVLGTETKTFGGIFRVFYVKHWQISNEVWAGALSWCNFHKLFAHKYERLCQIASCKRRRTVG